MRIWRSFYMGVFCLAPFWLWLGMYFFIAPDSAMTRAIVVGAGLFFLGVIQLICFGLYFFGALPIIWAVPTRRNYR